MTEKMKPSGLCEIALPIGWEYVRFRKLFSFGKGLSITKENLVEEGIPVISYGQVHSRTNTGTAINDTLIRFVPENYLISDKQALTRQGDFIFADTSEDLAGVGNCAFVDIADTLFAGYHSIIARPKEDMYPKYFAYQFLTDLWRDQIRAKVMGVKVFSVSQKLLRETAVYVPPKEEQRAIADFLDTQCTKIDSVIADIEKQIETLQKYKKSLITEAVTKGLDRSAPMKDSGIEWANHIPTHWQTTRMQEIGRYKKGPFGSAITLDMFIEKDETAVKIYEQKNAIQADATLGWYYISERDFAALTDFEVFPGDIIVSCAGTIGKCYIMPETMERGIINQALMKITLSNNVDSNYFLSLFDVALEYMADKYSNGSAIKNIPPFSVLKKQHIPFPSIEEQKKIASYIRQKSELLDGLIEEKKQQLQVMQDHKKSLIYEYVTGKKRVAEVN